MEGEARIRVTLEGLDEARDQLGEGGGAGGGNGGPGVGPGRADPVGPVWNRRRHQNAQRASAVERLRAGRASEADKASKAAAKARGSRLAGYAGQAADVALGPTGGGLARSAGGVLRGAAVGAAALYAVQAADDFQPLIMQTLEQELPRLLNGWPPEELRGFAQVIGGLLDLKRLIEDTVVGVLSGASNATNAFAAADRLGINFTPQEQAEAFANASLRGEQSALFERARDRMINQPANAEDFKSKMVGGTVVVEEIIRTMFSSPGR